MAQGLIGREARRTAEAGVAEGEGVHGVWLRLAGLAAGGDPGGPERMEALLDVAEIAGWDWLRTAATLSTLLDWDEAARALGADPQALREMTLPELAMLVRLYDLAALRRGEGGTEQGPRNHG